MVIQTFERKLNLFSYNDEKKMFDGNQRQDIDNFCSLKSCFCFSMLVVI